MTDIMVKVNNVTKQYRLGAIGGGTLQGDIESWWARKRGKEDPNKKIGEKAYKKNEKFYALNGVSLEIKRGERVGIIGHNGAGKSTLLKLLSRVTAPSSGEIGLNGRITSMLEVGTGFHGELTGRENIFMNGAILGMKKEEIENKIDDIIDFSECGQFIDTPVKRYSSGMYVKLAFAVAAHLDSDIMIMDEVLAVGDMAFQKKCLDKMTRVSETEGRTILYVSHNMSTIRQLCERCIVLDRGKLVYDGDVESAIQVYSGCNSYDNAVSFNLEKAPRPYEQHGKRMHINRFQFLNKDIAVFERTEPVTFKLQFDSNDDIAGIKLSFVLVSDSGIPIGLTQTFDSICNVEKGKRYSFDFSFDISNLSVGRYRFQLDIYSDDGAGHHWSYDHPESDICFEIIDSKSRGLLWQPQYYGHVMLNELKLIEEE